MSRAQTKVLQYVKEARASELALVRVLQSQIAMTPRGTLRSGLEKHLQETRDHAERLRVRAGELEHGFHPVALAVGVAEAVTGQALALAKTPLDLVRGTGGEEKVLKNAKDSSATEALEIATYTALERLAELAADTTTAELAASIRKDEEQMLGFLLEEIPTLTEAVYGADVEGDPSYDPTKTGAAEAVKGAADAAGDAADAATASATGAAKSAGSRAKSTAKGAANDAKDAANSASRSAKAAAGEAKDTARRTAAGAQAAASTAADDAKRTAGKVSDDAKDAANSAKDAVSDAADGARTTAKDAADDAQAAADTPPVDPDAEKPWAGYDELSVEEVRAVLLTADAETTAQVDAYERANRARKGILGVTEPQVQKA
jgi:ferritin-like metal-binding protein YciE